MSPVSQVWQTPVRHAHRTGTSQASASSSRLSNGGPQWTLRPLRANDTSGPATARAFGGCGGLGSNVAATPGVSDGPAPKVSVWIQRLDAPRPARPADRSAMNAAG